MSTLKSILDLAPKLGIELGSAVFEMSVFCHTILWYLARGEIKKGNGEPIMILPGFTATDGSLIFLVKSLEALGFSPYTWEQGKNHGRFEELKPGILKKFFQIHEEHDSPVELVGWSKGGRMSLKLANLLGPDLVSGVVTIGSPILPNSGRSMGDIPDFIKGELRHDIENIIEELQKPAPMPPEDIPYTAIVGGVDMIVPREDAILPDDLLHENAQNQIVKLCGHLGLGLSGRTVAQIVRHISGDFDHYRAGHDFAVA